MGRIRIQPGLIQSKLLYSYDGTTGKTVSHAKIGNYDLILIYVDPNSERTDSIGQAYLIKSINAVQDITYAAENNYRTGIIFYDGKLSQTYQTKITPISGKNDLNSKYMVIQRIYGIR